MKLKTHLAEYGNGSNYIPIPADKAEKLKKKFGKRVICVFPNKFEMHCAILRNDQVGHFIMVSKKTKRSIELESGQKFSLVFEKDISKYQLEMPEVLQEVLETDPDAMEAFERLTPGRQRSIIHMVKSAKRVDTQINRSLKIAENLKLGETDIRNFLK